MTAFFERIAERPRFFFVRHERARAKQAVAERFADEQVELSIVVDVGDGHSGGVRTGGDGERMGQKAPLAVAAIDGHAVDAEEEKGASKGKYEFAALTKLQRALDLEGIGQIKMDGGFTPESFEPANTVLTGTITYRDQSVPPVPLVYAKLALDRRAMSGLPQAVRDYASDEHLRFPHDPTLEQEYTEDRFIAYRELGWYLTCNARALDSWSSRRACYLRQ